MESSLLEAELTAQQLGLDELREEVARLRNRESLLSSRLTHWRHQANQEITEARQRLEAVEASLDLLEKEEGAEGSEDTDKELERLERIKQSHERLEAERRQFEDLEFRHMEQESVLEADRDEVLRELEAAERSLTEAEEEVREVERQAFEVSSGGADESRGMRDRREEVGHQLRSQQEKLSQLEATLAKLLRQSQGEEEGGGESDDSGTITLSDEETLGPKVWTAFQVFRNLR
jgi:pleckstrin homology-like domain family B